MCPSENRKREQTVPNEQVSEVWSRVRGYPEKIFHRHWFRAGCWRLENLPCTKRVDSQGLHTVIKSSHRTAITIFINIGHFSFSPYLLNSSTSMCVAILPLYCSIELFSCLAYFTVFACTYIVMIYLKWLSSFLLPCYVFMWQWPWPSVFLARISSWWRGSELVIYDLDITSFVLPCAAQRALICVDRTSYWGTQSSTLVSCFSQVESEKMEEDV